MKKWILPILFTAMGLIISLIVFKDLPDNIAIHFNSAGAADNWINKSIGAFLLPLLSIAIPLLITSSAKLEKDENKRRKIKATESSIFAVISTLLFTVYCFTIAFNLGYELKVSMFATVISGLLFIFVGNIIPRMPQGSLKWPKIPEEKQRKAASFQGRLMIMFGFVIVLLTFLPVNLIATTFLIVLATMIITLLASTFYFANQRA